MVVYQIHEAGGDGETGYDCIVGTYLSLDKANQVLENFRFEEKCKVELAEKCNKCPIYDYETFTPEVIKKINDYCSFFKPTRWAGCDNREERWDNSEFYLERVEVIE